MPFGKWDPLKDLIMLHDDLFGEGSDAALAEGTRAAWSPAIDIYETPDNFVLRAEVTGIDPNMIRLEFRDRKIILSGERPTPHREADRHYHQVERLYGPFERAIALPINSCCSDISANYKDGVLEITVPKQQLAGPKSIRVQG